MISTPDRRLDNRYPMSISPLERITLSRICATPPICYWAPRRAEIQRIVEIAKLAQGDGTPTILDIGCGNGFLSYLLARTGEVRVIGIDPDEEHLDKPYYNHPLLSFELGDAAMAAAKYKNQD